MTQNLKKPLFFFSLSFPSDGGAKEWFDLRDKLDAVGEF